MSVSNSNTSQTPLDTVQHFFDVSIILMSILYFGCQDNNCCMVARSLPAYHCFECVEVAIVTKAR